MKNNIEIVMLGDSIIARADWKSLLDNDDLINLGVDGDTTTLILNRVDTAISLEPKVLFIMAGINDLCLSIPIEEVFLNYKKILEKLRAHDIDIIVQATLLTQMPAVNKKVLVFNEMLDEYCEKEEVKFLDLNEVFLNEEGLLREDLTTDGLHLAQKAYKAWAYKIKRIL